MQEVKKKFCNIEIVDSTIYNLEVICAACYKYTDVYYIKQEMHNGSKLVNVIFEPKNIDIVNENLINEFRNDLIDQQVRFNVQKEFGHIRNLIVEEAFKPVNKQ